MLMRDVMLMERTMQHVAPADGAGANLTIPTISTVYGDVRPVALAVTGCAGDLAFTVGGGDEISVASGELAANAQYQFKLGPSDDVFVEADAGATTINIRWFWYNGVADGRVSGDFMRDDMTSKSEIIAVTSPEATITIPANAVALVLTDVLDGVGAEGITYRVDDGTANGIGVDVLEGECDLQHPYIIWLNDGDRLRMIRQATNDATVTGYWLIHP